MDEDENQRLKLWAAWLSGYATGRADEIDYPDQGQVTPNPYAKE